VPWRGLWATLQPVSWLLSVPHFSPTPIHPSMAAALPRPAPDSSPQTARRSCTASSAYAQQLPRPATSASLVPALRTAPRTRALHGVAARRRGGRGDLHLPATAAVRTGAALKTAPVASCCCPVAIQQKKRRVPRSLNRTESSKPKLCPICELVSARLAHEYLKDSWICERVE